MTFGGSVAAERDPYPKRARQLDRLKTKASLQPLGFSGVGSAIEQTFKVNLSARRAGDVIRHDSTH